MTREEAIEWLTDIKNVTENWSQEVAIDMAIEALQAEPTKAVPPSLADVYKWERDIALSQLEEYGIGFAEKGKNHDRHNNLLRRYSRVRRLPDVW